MYDDRILSKIDRYCEMTISLHIVNTVNVFYCVLYKVYLWTYLYNVNLIVYFCVV